MNENLMECISIAREQGYTEFARAAEYELKELSNNANSWTDFIESIAQFVRTLSPTDDIKKHILAHALIDKGKQP